MNNQKEKKNVLVKFIMMMIVAAIIGGVTSSFILSRQNSLQESIDIFSSAILSSAGVFLMVIGGAGIIITQFIIAKSKKSLKAMQKEDEDRLEQMEKTVSIAIGITEIGIVCSFVLFGLVEVDFVRAPSIGKTLINISLFIIIILIYVFQQRKLIEIMKDINPEKKGDALSLNFQKQWIDSCDELEKVVVYRSAYKAFQASQIACAVILGLLITGALFFNVGALPIAMIGIIWGIQTITYTRESLKKYK